MKNELHLKPRDMKYELCRIFFKGSPREYSQIFSFPYCASKAIRLWAYPRQKYAASLAKRCGDEMVFFLEDLEPTKWFINEPHLFIGKTKYCIRKNRPKTMIRNLGQ